MISKGYEKNIIHYFNNKGDTFLDIGANIGKYTVMQSKRYKNVHSFEPIPETHDALRKNTINLKNVTLHKVAAWNKEETLTFYIKNNPGGNSSEMLELYHDTLNVQAIDLDTYMNGIIGVDLIKIDIEGAEPQALEGMRQIIKINKPIMIIEILEENEQTVYSFMAEMGYRLVQKNKRNHLWYP
jgi:FkbM family methyltransferase